jgi:hypothetical protein
MPVHVGINTAAMRLTNFVRALVFAAVQSLRKDTEMNDRQGHPLQGIANLAFLIVAAWAMTVTLPMRRFSGKHYLKTTAAIGAMIIVCYTLFVPAPELAPLFFVFLFSVVLHLAGLVKMRFKGVLVHTLYNGDPWFTRRMFFCKDEHRCKAFVEPLVAIVIGFILVPDYAPCGVYFIIAGFAMVVVQAEIDKELQRRVDGVNDGRIENESLMREMHRRYHQHRGRRTR